MTKQQKVYLRDLLRNIEDHLEIAIEKKQKRGSGFRYHFSKYTVGVDPTDDYQIPLHDTKVPIGHCVLPVDEAIAYFQAQRDLLLFLLMLKS